MFDLYSALLDLDEDLERLARGIKAAEAVAAAISQSSVYGDGLFAVSDYLDEAQEQMRRDLDLCLERLKAAPLGISG